MNALQIIQQPAQHLQIQINADDALNQFLSEADVKERSRQTYKRQLRQYFHWLNINQTPLESVDKAAVLRFRDELKDRLSVYSVNGYICALRIFHDWLEEKTGLSNPAKRVKGLKKPRGKAKDALTSRQARRLVDSIERDSLAGKRDYAICLLMLKTGLRCVEVSRATIGDLRQEGNDRLLFVHGKGRDSADEFVLLTDDVTAAIYAYLQARGPAPVDTPLFASTSNRSRGKRIGYQWISQLVADRLKGAQLKAHRVSAHSLRHTAATIAIENGAAPQHVQAMMRHASLDTTMSVYYHNRARRENAAERLVTF